METCPGRRTSRNPRVPLLLAPRQRFHPQPCRSADRAATRRTRPIHPRPRRHRNRHLGRGRMVGAHTRHDREGGRDGLHRDARQREQLGRTGLRNLQTNWLSQSCVPAKKESERSHNLAPENNRCNSLPCYEGVETCKLSLPQTLASSSRLPSLAPLPAVQRACPALTVLK